MSTILLVHLVHSIHVVFMQLGEWRTGGELLMVGKNFEKMRLVCF
jgi:hypothetical protein